MSYKITSAAGVLDGLRLIRIIKRGEVPLPCCAFIIAHSWLFVKHFFVKSYIFPRRYLTRTSSKEDGRELPSPSRLEVIAPTFRTFFHSHLFCTLIVSQFGRFVKNFFEEFLFHLCRLGICCSSSLTPLLYHNLGGLSRGFFNFFYSFGRWLRRNRLKRLASSHTVTYGGYQFPISLVTHCFPLDNNILSHLYIKVNNYFRIF